MKKRKYTRGQILNLLDLVNRFIRIEALMRSRKMPASPGAQRMEHHKKRIKQWLAAEERVNAELRGPSKIERDEVHHLQESGTESRMAVHGWSFSSTPGREQST